VVDAFCAVHGAAGYGCRYDRCECGDTHVAARVGRVVVRPAVDHRLLHLGAGRHVADHGVVGRPFRQETDHADRHGRSGRIQRVGRLFRQHRTVDRFPD
jgi:hypothetical protein